MTIVLIGFHQETLTEQVESVLEPSIISRSSSLYNDIMTKDRFRQWSIFIFVLLGLIPQIVVSGSMPYISIDNLWENSEVAVLGNVTSIQPSNEGGFYRIVEIKVEESYIQTLNESTVKIRIEGGEFGGMGYWVEDQPEFELGEKVFVFLRTPEEIKGDYEYVVHGLDQGKFSVNGSKASLDNGRSFEIPNFRYTGIEFQQTLIVALGVVLLSILIVWLL